MNCNFIFWELSARFGGQLATILERISPVPHDSLQTVINLVEICLIFHCYLYKELYLH